MAKNEPSLNQPYEREKVREKQYDPEEGDSVHGDSEDEDVSRLGSFPSFFFLLR